MFKRVCQSLIAISLCGLASTSVVHATSIPGGIDGFAPGWIWNGMSEWDDPSLVTGRGHAGGPEGYGSYTFTGTGVEIYGTVGPTVEVDGRVHRMGALRVSIDGKQQETDSVRKSSSQYDVLIARVTGLPQQIHVLEVAPVDGWAVVEYIKVIDSSHPAMSTDVGGAGKPKSTDNKLGAPIIKLSVGGPGVDGWLPDSGVGAYGIGVYGGQIAVSSDVIDTSGIEDPAPKAVYDTERWGQCSFAIPGLVPDALYNLRLDFADTFYTQPRQRLFDVMVNGRYILQNFDIIAASGGKDRAIDVVVPVVADANGGLNIEFLRGAVDNPMVCGISLYRPTTAASAGS